MNILDYNNALNTYNQNPSATSYNNVLNMIPPQNGSNDSGGDSFYAPAAVANTAPNATDSANTNPLADYNSILGGLNNNTNNYFGQQLGFYNTENQLQNALYSATNQNLLGTQSSGDSANFLNSIENPLQKSEGLYQYQYGLDTGNENAMYGLQSTANTQNRQNALDKLAMDENFNMANLGLQQGNTNSQDIDSYNQRGLLYGQSPTGAYEPNAMGGMGGLAGFLSGRENQGFNNQRGQMQGDYGLNVQGTQNQYNQAQNQLNQTHNYNLASAAMNTSNDINQQNYQNTYNVGMANNSLAQYKASINNQQQQQLANNPQTAYNQALIKNNAYTATS